MAQKRALVVVDVQRDFCPGGSLAVDKGDLVVPKLNQVIEAFTLAGLPCFFTRDWHPPNHRSFNSEGGTWPPHCVRGTSGAAFHPDLIVPSGAVVISKGTLPKREAYSGFQGTDLEEQLHNRGVDEVVVGGLATDYCVKETVVDALKSGFLVTVLEDCVSGVDLRKNDSVRAVRLMLRRGATAASSADVIRMIGARQ